LHVCFTSPTSFARTEFAKGPWIGVELEKKLGKNNGSVEGVEYFRCTMGHGVFVKWKKVSVVALHYPLHSHGGHCTDA